MKCRFAHAGRGRRAASQSRLRRGAAGSPPRTVSKLVLRPLLVPARDTAACSSCSTRRHPNLECGAMFLSGGLRRANAPRANLLLFICFMAIVRLYRKANVGSRPSHRPEVSTRFSTPVERYPSAAPVRLARLSRFLLRHSRIRPGPVRYATPAGVALTRRRDASENPVRI